MSRQRDASVDSPDSRCIHAASKIDSVTDLSYHLPFALTQRTTLLKTPKSEMKSTKDSASNDGSMARPKSGGSSTCMQWVKQMTILCSVKLTSLSLDPSPRR